jgi:hypothetical protein
LRENPPWGSRVVPCGRTDGRTDISKLTVAFHNFANAPRKEKARVLTDVAVPADRSVTQKEAAEKLKCKSSRIKIQGMCNTKCVSIAVVRIAATGTVTNGLKEHSEATPGEHSADSVQKTAVLGTADVMRKVLQSVTGSLNGGGGQLVS